MSTIEDLDIREIATGNRSMCGEPSTGFWFGREPIEICPDCMEKLPLLFVDSLPSRRLTSWGIEHALHMLTEQFWRGLALRLLRERNR